MIVRVQTRAVRAAAILAIAAGVAGRGTPALAQPDQNVKVDVKVVLSDQIVKDILRDVHQIVRVAGESRAAADITEAIRSAIDTVKIVGIAGLPPGVFDQTRGYNVEQTDREVRTLALGPTGFLELRNVVGDITVTAGTGRDISVEIVRRSRARTEEDAKLGLERVKVQVDQRGERATVQQVYPSGRNNFNVSAAYTVTAPAGTRLSIGGLSGTVVVRGIKGDQSVNITSGNVTISDAGQVSDARALSGNVTLTDVTATGSVKAGTISGTVALTRVKAPRVVIDATTGAVTALEMICDNADLKSLTGAVEYSGTLSRGGRYDLQSHAGSIRFTAVGPAGFELQASTFAGEIRPDAAVEIKGITATRRSLRGTVGDGSAIVSLTTFNGGVVVSRK